MFPDIQEGVERISRNMIPADAGLRIKNSNPLTNETHSFTRIPRFMETNCFKLAIPKRASEQRRLSLHSYMGGYEAKYRMSTVTDQGFAFASATLPEHKDREALANPKLTI